MLATTCLIAANTELSAQKIKPTPVKAIALFDAAKAKALQIAWADYLGVPVEFTNSINMKFAVIPPGEFMMGSPDSEPGRLDNEKG